MRETYYLFFFLNDNIRLNYCKCYKITLKITLKITYTNTFALIFNDNLFSRIYNKLLNHDILILKIENLDKSGIKTLNKLNFLNSRYELYFLKVFSKIS